MLVQKDNLRAVVTRPCTIMELDLLDKKIRRLVHKLATYNVSLEVFNHEEIEYGSVLGRGGEGTVQKCTVIYNGLPVDAAAKRLFNNSDDAICLTLDEIELLCLGRDPIIQTTLRVYGVAAVPDESDPDLGALVIITEAGLMNALQLYQDEEVPLHVTFQLWAQIAAAVHLLHAKKILHQDLKPENILITNITRDTVGCMEKVDCKIIDLGMGKRVYTEKVVTDDILGTNGYHPPEVLLEDSYDFRADVFMLGITFCVMLHSPAFLKRQLTGLLKRLHEAKKKHQVGHVLFENLLEPNMENAQNIPASIRNMLCTMLECQDQRDVELPQVVELCRTVARDAREQQSHLPPILSPIRNNEDDVDARSDSGFSSCNLRSPSLAQRRPRRACTSRTNSICSSRTMTSNAGSVEASRRQRKRKMSGSCSGPGSSCDLTPPPPGEERVKRARRCRSVINYALL